MKKKDKDMTVADHLRNFDFYKDLPRELQEPSVSGATSKAPIIIHSLDGRNGDHGFSVLQANLLVPSGHQDQ